MEARMSCSRNAALSILLALPLLARGQTAGTAEDRHKPAQLAGIEVTGTRLPFESIIKISGLKVGQTINDDILKQASDKITSTGLVKGLDYGYNLVPGKAGVYLSLKVFDEEPLLPARILPAESAELIWTCLQSADPIFTREMPNTEKAIHFYSINIARCMGNSGAAGERVAATVACDGTGKSIGIDFHVKPVSAGRNGTN
jgi:hypothetical protein